MMVPESCLTLGRELALHEDWKAPVEGGLTPGTGSTLPHRNQLIPGTLCHRVLGRLEIVLGLKSNFQLLKPEASTIPMLFLARSWENLHQELSDQCAAGERT